MAGALELAACYQYFPSGTVFLVVVDPGVGSARRGIAAEAGDYRFVAPDNGVLSAVLHGDAAAEGGRAHRAEVRAAHHQPHVRGPRSLRAGGRLARQGRSRWRRSAAASATMPAWSCPTRARPRRASSGVVLHVDRFGNCITNIERRDVDKRGPRRPVRRHRRTARNCPHRHDLRRGGGRPSRARCSAAPITWRSRSSRGAPPTAVAVGGTPWWSGGDRRREQGAGRRRPPRRASSLLR